MLCDFSSRFPTNLPRTHVHVLCFSFDSSRGFTNQSRRSRKRKWHRSHGVQWKRSNSISMWCKVWKSSYWNANKSIKYRVCMSSIRLCVNRGINLAPKKMCLHRVLHATCNKHLPICSNVVQRTRAKSSVFWICGRRTMSSYPKSFSHCSIWPIRIIPCTRIRAHRRMQTSMVSRKTIFRFNLKSPFTHHVSFFSCPIFVGMLSGITQESPAANMADEGHTMSSDMSGPVRFQMKWNKFGSIVFAHFANRFGFNSIHSHIDQFHGECFPHRSHNHSSSTAVDAHAAKE